MSRLPAALVSTALVAAFVAGGVGGTAVAKGKIKGKQIAPRAIATKHLKGGAVTGDKIATGAVTGAKIAPGSVTGTQVDESTLGRVPDAAAVGGMTVTPISLKLPNTLAAPVQVAAGPGWTLTADCGTSTANALVTKVGKDSLLTLEGRANGSGPIVTNLPGSGNFGMGTTAFALDVVAVTAGTATTTVHLVASFAAGQFTSQTDCFFNGTVTTTP